MRLVALLALVGCSFPEKHRATGDGGGGSNDTSAIDTTGTTDGPRGDAGSGPFGCVGLPFPTSAPPQITFQGLVQMDNGNPFPQIQVQGHLNQGGANGPQFFVTTSDSNGNYMATAPTNSSAIDGHIFVNAPLATGFMPLYYYPRHPFDADQLNLSLAVYSQNTLQQLYNSVGQAFNSQAATLLFQLTDCNGTPIAGARLQMVPQPTQIYYMRNNVPDATVGMTDSTGVAIVLGVNPINVELSGQSSMGQPLHTYQISIAPQSVYEILMQP